MFAGPGRPKEHGSQVLQSFSITGHDMNEKLKTGRREGGDLHQRQPRNVTGMTLTFCNMKNIYYKPRFSCEIHI